jgi:hypothetical protein
MATTVQRIRFARAEACAAVAAREAPNRKQLSGHRLDQLRNLRVVKITAEELAASSPCRRRGPHPSNRNLAHRDNRRTHARRARPLSDRRAEKFLPALVRTPANKRPAVHNVDTTSNRCVANML